MRIDFSKVPYAFNPGIGFPAYLLRKKLSLAIAAHTHYLSGRMMDFGCGSKPYQSLFTVGEYVGVDFNGQGHSHENEQIDVFYDGQTLPFKDAEFDSVFSSEVFEHVFNLEHMLPEIGRVMKPGASILVTCPFAIAEHEAPNDYARYTSFGLKHLFEKNGFEVIEYKKVGNHFETIMQLRIMYLHMYLMPKFNKLVIVKPILEFLLYPLLNLYTLAMSKLLPNRNDLYMNNLVVCKKR
jgi:SAM-dependent methyltransferase